MQNQVFVTQKPMARPWTTAASCLTCSGHKGPSGQEAGEALPGQHTLASPEAIPRHGKGWLPRNTWVLAPKSIMTTCPAGNHGHEDTNNWERVELTSAPAPASAVPLCARGQAEVTPGQHRFRI